jgi:predicted O-linked N-acetylglucosamine transferase (SPINDLY family)
VNAPLLALWARILAAVPGSRLVMMNAASPDAAERVRKAFADGGVDPERLVLEGRLPYADHMELHNRVDIGLDAYPFNGGTTSYTAAWMGVPHVTLCGRRPCSRHGRQLFGNLGLDDLVTETADDYVDRAVALAGDIAGLEELRRSLRPRMAASPVTDGAAQTRALEDAYRRMWVKALADSDA